MTSKPQIDILLSCFNGQKYLEALLDSIEKQSNTSWRLIVRDDGSQDSSKKIVASFRQKHPVKVQIIEDAGKNAGPKDSFGILLKYTDASYCMFCDQDDIWLPDKIALTYEKMKEVERNPNVPTLVYTDLTVVNDNLEPIADSFFKYQNIGVHQDHDKYYVAYKNPAAGCTIMINHSAVCAIQPLGTAAIMHDWWIIMGCLAKGTIACVNKPTVLYRQHTGNLLGAEENNTTGLLKYIGRLLSPPERLLRILAQHRRQISQAKEAGNFFNYPFYPFWYYVKIFCGRILFPFLAPVYRNALFKTWNYR
jgi:glycosyltransferase involved in cell wall biosynthesis